MQAPIQLTTTIKGSEELQKRLSTRGDAVRDNVQEVLKEAALDIADRARGLAPYRKGKLQRSIKYRFFSKPGLMSVRIQPRWYVGRFMEYGVAQQEVDVKGYVRKNKALDVRGTVISKTGKARKGVVSKGVSFVKPYDRPFHINARPFMTPAYQGREDTVREQIRAAVFAALGD